METINILLISCLLGIINAAHKCNFLKEMRIFIKFLDTYFKIWIKYMTQCISTFSEYIILLNFIYCVAFYIIKHSRTICILISSTFTGHFPKTHSEKSALNCHTTVKKIMWNCLKSPEVLTSFLCTYHLQTPRPACNRPSTIEIAEANELWLSLWLTNVED